MPESEAKLCKKLAPNASLINTFHVTDTIKAVKSLLNKKPIDLLGKRKEILLDLPKIEDKRAIIQISQGCTSYCSFCETKLAKGVLISFPKEKIIQEKGADSIEARQAIIQRIEADNAEAKARIIQYQYNQSLEIRELNNLAQKADKSVGDFSSNTERGRALAQDIRVYRKDINDLNQVLLKNAEDLQKLRQTQ